MKEKMRMISYKQRYKCPKQTINKPNSKMGFQNAVKSIQNLFQENKNLPTLENALIKFVSIDHEKSHMLIILNA